MRHFEQFLNNVYWSDWAQIRYFFKEMMMGFENQYFKNRAHPTEEPK